MEEGLLIIQLICIFCVISMASSSRLSNGLANSSKVGMRVELSRIHTSTNLTERLVSAMERSTRRVEYMQALMKKTAVSVKATAESPVHPGSGDYLMSIGVGTPVVSFDAIMDTGSDLIWTQCKPCTQCYEQPTPIFDPSKSTTYKTLDCSDSLCEALGSGQAGCLPGCQYTYAYGDNSSTYGLLSSDTLRIGNETKVPDIAFGCGTQNIGEGFEDGGGLVGLGRGSLSLISQLGDNADNKFSYCLVSITESRNTTSPLFFGDAATIRGGQTMSLIKNDQNPTFWYVPITGITVEGKAVDIPQGTFDLREDGSGGMIIDSGTTLTLLDSAAYQPFLEAVKSATHLTPASYKGFDLCYEVPSDSSNITVPSVTFNFEDGLDMDLPAENCFLQVTDNVLCLFMSNADQSFSVLGNIQHQNFQVLYDNAKNELSMKPAECKSL